MQRRCFIRNRLASRVGTLITIVLTLWPSPAIVSAQRKSERELHVMAREIRRVNSVDGLIAAVNDKDVQEIAVSTDLNDIPSIELLPGQTLRSAFRRLEVARRL
jgi:hypothetical protein